MFLKYKQLWSTELGPADKLSNGVSDIPLDDDVPSEGSDLQGPGVEISEEETGEEERSSESEAVASITAILVTHAVVDHHLQTAVSKSDLQFIITE